MSGKSYREYLQVTNSELWIPLMYVVKLEYKPKYSNLIIKILKIKKKKTFTVNIYWNQYCAEK